MTTSPSYETQIALLVEHQKELERLVTDLRADVVELKQERTRALLWGVMTLGSAVVAMGVWIFIAVTGGHPK